MRTLLRIGTVALAIAVPATQASAERLFGLTSGNAVVTFDSNAPLTEKSRGAISGIITGDKLTGIDFRPADRMLYSVGTSGRTYKIVKNPIGRDYTATALPGTVILNGTSFGIDFNPTVDRLRFISDTGQNLRINPNNGALGGNDTMITLNGSSNVDLIGAAYTNNRAGAKTTVLYGLDAVSGGLIRSINPNGGLYVNTNLAGMAFGPLGVGFTKNNLIGFDISGGGGKAYFGVDSALFGLNLSTGAATNLGTIGSGSLTGLTASAVPEPATWAMMIGGFGIAGVSLRSRRRRTTQVLA